MKSYVKPELFYESFELNYSVASCHVVDGDTNNNGRYEEWTNASNGNDCTYTLSPFVLFKDSNSACEVPYNMDAEYCYHTGTGAYNFFSS